MINDINNKPFFIKTGFSLLLPFLLWIYFFRNFLSGQIVINVDTLAHYSNVKYYLNNLLNGVMPMWEPFVFLGRPFVAIVSAGLLNPLIYLVAILKMLGVNFYNAYLIYIAVFYFIGLLGFYLLAKKIFKNKLYAWIGYVLLLFSGMGGMAFNQMYALLLFTPSVWFFYFFVRFTASYKKSDFWGMTFSLLLISGSYYPFYFLTLLLTFLIIYCILFPAQLLENLHKTFLFSRKNVPLILFCLLAIMISLLPLFIYTLRDKTSEIISPTRHQARCVTDEQACFEGSKLLFSEVATEGTLMERVNIARIFSHLSKVRYFVDDFFYIPFLSYILIFISIFTVFDRLRLLLLCVGTVIFLISIGAATPVHQFLYNHVYYFKYFRNFFFFMAYLIPLAILFSVAQLKAMVDQKIMAEKSRSMIFLILFSVGMGLFLLLKNQGDILTTTYFTLFLSTLFFGLFFMGMFSDKKHLFWLGLFVLTIIEPSEVFYHYQKNAKAFQCTLPNTHVIPEFSFTRPLHTETKEYDIILKNRNYDFEYNMALQDSDGYMIDFPDSISRWTYLMYRRLGNDIMGQYTHHKFILYDHAVPWSVVPEEDRAKVFADAIENKQNLAFISTDDTVSPDLSLQKDLKSNSQAQIISKPADDFKILHFDVNSLKLLTNFPIRKFLVYNDSYNKDWKVYINGNTETLYRSNIAFKGIWLPAGKNVVDFKYEPPGGQGIYIFISGFILLFFIYTLFMLQKEHDITSTT